ncbi:hypothetical protein ACH49_24365 [Streptomyces leeuwenhoekii]|uniref:Uncharacterized protein n=1 Tax=Streptomyces leeuwenhoekii TaxID=1437453 RepID=A0ABR5HT82_STRLW|nr:hypothetical protein [Streptomyces leeuwenhoekii]KMS71762.1 hypothetical protein ACH49_24365 [Streptomyces leeuwenhoekii]
MTTRTAPKPTDSEPFDFNLDAVQAEADLRPFRVHWGGRRFEMQHLEALDIWELMEAAEKGEAGAMVGAFREALGDQWDDFRAIRLPQFKLKALFDAYRKHCGLEPGESAASGS